MWRDHRENSSVLSLSLSLGMGSEGDISLPSTAETHIPLTEVGDSNASSGQSQGVTPVLLGWGSMKNAWAISKGTLSRVEAAGHPLTGWQGDCWPAVRGCREIGQKELIELLCPDSVTMITSWFCFDHVSRLLY